MKNNRFIFVFTALLIICAMLFASCVKNPGGVPVTNEYGEPITDANGDEITVIPETEVVTVTDEAGVPVTDENGQPVTTVVYKEVTVAVPVTDGSGNAMTDADGNAVTEKIGVTPTYPSQSGNNTGTATKAPVTTRFVGTSAVLLTDGQGNTALDESGNPITYTVNVTAPVTLPPSEITATSWKKTVGGTQSDYFSDVVSAPGGGSVALLVSNSTDGDLADVPSEYGRPSTAVIKNDVNGNVVWKTYIGGSGVTTLTSLATAADGSIYAIGYCSSSNIEGIQKRGSYDCAVFKLDASGRLLWARNFGTSVADMFLGACTLSDGGVVCVGSVGTNNGDAAGFGRASNQSTACMVRYNANGDVVWSKVDGGDRDRYLSVCADAEDNLYVSGIFYSNYYFDVVGKSDAGVIKFDSDGNRLWVTPVGGSGIDYFPAIALAPDSDGCVLAGRSDSTDGYFTETLASRGMYDAYIVRVNRSGILYWGSAFRGQNYDSFSRVICTQEGYVLTGESGSTTRDLKTVGNRGGLDIVAVCFTYGGQLSWSRGFGGSYDDRSAGICEANGGYVVTGQTLSFDADLAEISGPASDGVTNVGVIYRFTK